MSERAGIEELRAFLLGRLSEAERNRIEEALLEDEELFELSLALEDELVDELVRGDLSEAESEVLTGYLSRLPDGSSRVQVAKAFEKKRRSQEDRVPLIPESGPTRMKPLWAWISPPGERFYRAAILVLAVGVALSTFKNLRLLNLVHGMREELGRSEAKIQELEVELRQPSSVDPARDRPAETIPRVEGSASSSEPDHASASRTTVLLTAGTFRGARADRPLVRVTNYQVIDLMLDLGADEYPTYRAALCDADGREIASSSQLRAQSSDERILLAFPILADWLARGDYFVDLEGVTPSGRRESIGRYDFRAQLQSPRDPTVPKR
jgi:hypothetical protein